MTALHIIEIEHRRREGPEVGKRVGLNVYSMVYLGELLGEFESPLCDAARILISRRLAAPGDQIATARGGKIGLTAGGGWAAKRIAREDRLRSPHWDRWRPFDWVSHGRVRAPAAISGSGAISAPPGETAVLDEGSA